MVRRAGGGRRGRSNAQEVYAMEKKDYEITM